MTDFYERTRPMKSILEQFACGSINPAIRFIKRGSTYEKAGNTLCAAEEKLRAVLNEDERLLLTALIEAQGAVNDIANMDKLVHGYRLGALMTMEVFSGKEDLASGGTEGNNG